MARKRVTQIFPFLIPIRVWQRNLFYYIGMYFDKNTYSKKVSNLLPYEVCNSKTLMINENSGHDIIYQKNKVDNLKIISRTMNQVLIQPGETFSFCYLSRKSKKYGKLKDGLILVDNKIVPTSFLFDQTDSYEKIEKEVSKLKFPLFVKPLKARSSFGITKILSIDHLKDAVEAAFQYDNKITIEENIDGFEVGCAVLGNHDLVIGEVDEIELKDGFFDYFEKYNLKTSEIHLPARLSEEEREKIKKIALEIYQILGCSGFARVDMFYTKDKTIVFNEVNTIPGCTSHSRYPSMLKKIGMSFESVIDRLIELGLER